MFSLYLSSAGKIRLPVNFELKFSSPLFNLLIQRKNYKDDKLYEEVISIMGT